MEKQATQHQITCNSLTKIVVILIIETTWSTLSQSDFSMKRNYQTDTQDNC